jgi:hypothetical protein
MTRTSSIKLGLAVVWPAFWTGVPIKIVLVLLYLAAGLHPWEMPGLAFLLLLSIPIDIWALNLASRTVFLERLRLEPPDGLGLTLWWQIAALTAVYGPIAYLIEAQTIAIGKTATGWMLDLIKGIPVAERISIELVLWGSAATVVLLLLVLGWLYGVGWIVQRQARAARPSQAPYPAVVQRVDLLRIPADQPLTLIVFVGSGVLLVLLLWAFMPVTTPHPHEEYKKAAGTAKTPKALKPAEVLQKTETVIAQAESSVQALEAKAKNQSKDKDKAAKGKAGAKAEAEAKGVGKTKAKSEETSRKADAHDSTPPSH